MYITLEEMYAMKKEYQEKIIALEMKQSVVDDFIAIAEAKSQAKSESVELSQAEEYPAPVLDITTDGNY